MAAVRAELGATQAAAAQAAEHHQAVLALRDEQVANAKTAVNQANDALERERQQLVEERRLHGAELARALADLELWRQQAQATPVHEMK